MGTNFYWLKSSCNYEHEDDPIVHIGKRYAAGEGRMGFIWAQPPAEVVKLLTQYWREPVVRDDSGREYTGKDFRMGVLDECDPSADQYDQIGRWFS